MKASTVHELKQELSTKSHTQLIETCLRLVKFKKENKELLTFLLFESHNMEDYIQSVKSLIDDGLEGLPKPTAYLTKKSVRKVLRATMKYIRYSGSKQTETELLIYFCTTLKNSGILNRKSASLTSLYENQIKKIRNAINDLHDDLQYDYLKQVEGLLSNS